MGFYFAHLNGLSFEYLWPSSPKLNFWSTTFTLGLGTCSIGLFSRKILNIKEYSKLLDKIVLYSSFAALSLSIGPFILPTKNCKRTNGLCDYTPVCFITFFWCLCL
jgi:hypothetical protein